MSDATNKIQDKIFHNALTDIPFDGLSWDVVLRAAEKAGYDSDVCHSVFPDKMTDFLKFFSQWADRQMLDALQNVDITALKIRDRIEQAVWTRLEGLSDHKETVRLSLKHWVNPMRKPVVAKMIWATADVMWDWAGDTATDYNKYTKRLLLSGVISATTLFWLNDKSDNHEKTRAFLKARIGNVLKLGQFTGKIFGKKAG